MALSYNKVKNYQIQFEETSSHYNSPHPPLRPSTNNPTLTQLTHRDPVILTTIDPNSPGTLVYYTYSKINPYILTVAKWPNTKCVSASICSWWVLTDHGISWEILPGSLQILELVHQDLSGPSRICQDGSDSFGTKDLSGPTRIRKDPSISTVQDL